MLKIFRGDTLLLDIVANNYKFKTGDKIHYAVMNNVYSKNYLYEDEIVVDIDSEMVEIEIKSEYTKNFDVGNLLFEIELTYGADLVVTNQYQLTVEADGIYDRS